MCSSASFGYYNLTEMVTGKNDMKIITVFGGNEVCHIGISILFYVDISETDKYDMR